MLWLAAVNNAGDSFRMVAQTVLSSWTGLCLIHNVLRLDIMNKARLFRRTGCTRMLLVIL